MDFIEYINSRNSKMKYPKLISLISKLLWVEKLFFYTLDLTKWEPPRVPRMRLNFEFILGNEMDIVTLASDPRLEATGEEVCYLEKIRLGHKLLLGKLNGEIIFYLWIVKDSKKLMNKALALKTNEIAIERGFTRKDFRGHGLFVYGIIFLFPIIIKEGATSCLTEIASHNTPMIKTASKIGFEVTESYYYWINTPFKNYALLNSSLLQQDYVHHE